MFWFLFLCLLPNSLLLVCFQAQCICNNFSRHRNVFSNSDGFIIVNNRLIKRKIAEKVYRLGVTTRSFCAGSAAKIPSSGHGQSENVTTWIMTLIFIYLIRDSIVAFLGKTINNLSVQYMYTKNIGFLGSMWPIFVDFILILGSYFLQFWSRVKPRILRR